MNMTDSKRKILTVLAFVALVAAAILIVVAWRGADNTEGSLSDTTRSSMVDPTTSGNSSGKEDTKTEEETSQDTGNLTTESSGKSDYLSCSSATMVKELDANLDSAKAKYLDKAVTFTATFTAVSGNRNYIELHANTGNEELDEIPFTCYLSGSDQQQTASNLEVGSQVTIYGTVTFMGSLSGYEVNIDRMVIK